jgi:hypothetical protein
MGVASVTTELLSSGDVVGAGCFEEEAALAGVVGLGGMFGVDPGGRGLLATG